MTQAFNLAQFANNLNSSGATSNSGLQNSSITINTTSPITGGASTALGSSLTIAHANSGVSANTYTAATITVNAQGHVTAASSNTVASGTVTSVATGNGLSGGTITSSGTLVVACPGFNTVGSYAQGQTVETTSNTYEPNGNYAAGVGVGNVYVYSNSGGGNVISGTWKSMNEYISGVGTSILICRVS